MTNEFKTADAPASYSAVKRYEPEDKSLYVSTGEAVGIISIRKYEIYLIGGEELKRSIKYIFDDGTTDLKEKFYDLGHHSGRTYSAGSFSSESISSS